MSPVGTRALRQGLRQKFRGGFARFLLGSNLFLLLPALVVVSGGCASNSAMVITQRHTTDSLSATNKIVLTGQSRPRPEEQVLRRILTAELEQDGFDVVSPTQADYTLGYWLDESWNATPDESGFPQPFFPLPQRTVMFGPGGTVESYGEPDSLPVEVPASRFKPERMYLPTKGIRLCLYPNHGSVSEKLSPVWEGYIELGKEASQERETLMVKTLLAHFCKNFKGRARLKK